MSTNNSNTTPIIATDADTAAAGSNINPTPATPKTPPAVGSTITGKVFRSAAQDKPFVLVQIEGGFMGLLHESQLSGKDRATRNGRLRSLGAKQELELVVLEVGEKEGKTRISLSERALETQKSLSGIPVGSDVTGTVQNTEVYGAFIDLGNGLSGLLHVKEMNGNSPREQESALSGLTKGMAVTVRVIDVDTTKGPKVRIALSMRAEAQGKVMERLQSGTPIKGAVIGKRDGNYTIALGSGVVGLLSMDEVRPLEKGGHVRVKLESVDGDVIKLTRKGIA